MLTKQIAQGLLQRLNKLPHNDIDDTLGSLIFLIEQLIEELTVKERAALAQQLDNNTGATVKLQMIGDNNPRTREVMDSPDWELIQTLLNKGCIVFLECKGEDNGDDFKVSYCGSVQQKYLMFEYPRIERIFQQLNPPGSQLCAIRLGPTELI